MFFIYPDAGEAADSLAGEEPALELSTTVFTIFGEDSLCMNNVNVSRNFVDSSILHMSVWPRRHISAPESAARRLEPLGSAATSSRAGTSIASIS